MIHILDEVVLAPDRVDEVLQRLQRDYLPAARRRGLILQQQWLSPPVARADQPNTLWLLWQLPGDVMAYYGMRGAQGPEVAEFWQQLTALIVSRRRHVLTAPNHFDSAVPAGVPGHA